MRPGEPASIPGVTVAACILAASPHTALRDVEGTPNVRRLVDLAWAGGAFPVVVVAADPDGAVATALAGAEVILGAPAPAEAEAPVRPGPERAHAAAGPRLTRRRGSTVT